MRFLLQSGTYTDKQGKEHTAGEVIESNMRLDQRFVNKFTLLPEPPQESSPETPPQDTGEQPQPKSQTPPPAPANPPSPVPVPPKASPSSLPPPKPQAK